MRFAVGAPIITEIIYLRFVLRRRQNNKQVRFSTSAAHVQRPLSSLFYFLIVWKHIVLSDMAGRKPDEKHPHHSASFGLLGDDVRTVNFPPFKGKKKFPFDEFHCVNGSAAESWISTRLVIMNKSIGISQSTYDDDPPKLLWRSSRGELRSKNRHRKSANVFACPSTSFLSPYVAPKLSL